MRKILLGFAGFLTLGAASVRADVLIYKIVESSRTIGSNANRAGTAGGYMVFDWETNEVRVLRARLENGSRQFTISNPQGIRTYIAKGPNNSTYTVFTRYQEKSAPYTEILDVMHGPDQVLAIRPDRQVYSPKVLKGSPKEVIVPESGDDVILVTSTVTATFMGVETQAANAANQTVDGVMEEWPLDKA